MELGFWSVSWKRKEKNKQRNPPHKEKNQPYQTSQETFIFYCFLLVFGMTLELINNNANLIVAL